MVFTGKTLRNIKAGPRHIFGKKPPPAVDAPTDPALGPFELLPGVWRNEPSLPGRGWNLIAVPFPTEGLNYRLLLNQYNEELEFSLVDKGVPNRGIRSAGDAVDPDQLLVSLDYEQQISQIAIEDFPVSGKRGELGAPIHHEPGLFLHAINQVTDGLTIARLATIPHGDSVLALGRADVFDGPPSIPAVSALPIGVVQDLSLPYLAPYARFHETKFPSESSTGGNNERIFDPLFPHELLRRANQDPNLKIKRTTVLDFDTELGTGGIHNIPFVVSQANATAMKSTFWIEEVEETKTAEDGTKQTFKKLRLQYLQIVFLDFFPRADGAGLIRWPHISINTLEKVGSAVPVSAPEASERC